jgi:hypothetical protein
MRWVGHVARMEKENESISALAKNQSQAMSTYVVGQRPSDGHIKMFYTVSNTTLCIYSLCYYSVIAPNYAASRRRMNSE